MSIESDYTNPKNPGSFAGLSTFQKNNKIYDKNDINKALTVNETYSLHKPVRHQFPRRKTIAEGPNDVWMVDLIDCKKVKHQNGNNSFLMTVIDVFTKMAWVIPIKNKEAKSCRTAFEYIFSSYAKPAYIYHDKGNEFRGECKKLFDELDIISIDTKSKHKASVVERFNQTIRNKIQRYVTYSGSKRFIDVLPDLVDSYNHTIHTATGMRPADVSCSDVDKLKLKMYGDEEEQILVFKFKTNDMVRVVIDKGIYEKSSTAGWSKELYQIVQCNPTIPPTYKIKDSEGRILDWKFYEPELQLIKRE